MTWECYNFQKCLYYLGLKQLIGLIGLDTITVCNRFQFWKIGNLLHQLVLYNDSLTANNVINEHLIEGKTSLFGSVRANQILEGSFPSCLSVKSSTHITQFCHNIAQVHRTWIEYCHDLILSINLWIKTDLTLTNKQDTDENDLLKGLFRLIVHQIDLYLTSGNWPLFWVVRDLVSRWDWVRSNPRSGNQRLIGFDTITNRRIIDYTFL